MTFSKVQPVKRGLLYRFSKKVIFAVLPTCLAARGLRTRAIGGYVAAYLETP